MLPRSLERLMWFGKVGNPWGGKNPPSDTSPPTGASGAVRMLPLMSIPLKFRCPVGDVATVPLLTCRTHRPRSCTCKTYPTQTERQLQSPFTINHLNARRGILALDEPPRLHDGFRIIAARQPDEPNKMSVTPDEICSII